MRGDGGGAVMADMYIEELQPREKGPTRSSPYHHQQGCNCLCFNRGTKWPCPKGLLWGTGAAGALIVFSDFLPKRHCGHLRRSELHKMFNS